MTMTTSMIQNDNDATLVGGGEGKVAEFIYSHKTAPQNAGLGMFNSLHTNALTFVGWPEKRRTRPFAGVEETREGSGLNRGGLKLWSG